MNHPMTPGTRVKSNPQDQLELMGIALQIAEQQRDAGNSQLVRVVAERDANIRKLEQAESQLSMAFDFFYAWAKEGLIKPEHVSQVKSRFPMYAEFEAQKKAQEPKPVKVKKPASEQK